MSLSPARIAQNLADVRGRIVAAASRAGRDASEVKLVAVTKYVGLDEIRALVEAGCMELGESRPQQLWERAEALADLSIRWHLIGHLQRNKVRRTVPLVTMIHSVDSARLVEALDEALCSVGILPAGCSVGILPANGSVGTLPAAPTAVPPTPGDSSRDGCTTIHRLPVLLEVNVSGEAAKHGFAVDEIETLVPDLGRWPNLEIRGLMCMAGLEGDLEEARREFAALRCLRDRLRSQCPPGVSLDELSMGMSGDYEVAIEEGATIVRIGSALFEGV